MTQDADVLSGISKEQYVALYKLLDDKWGYAEGHEAQIATQAGVSVAAVRHVRNRQHVFSSAPVWPPVDFPERRNATHA